MIFDSHLGSTGILPILAILGALPLLDGCGPGSEASSNASPVVAKVNGEGISARQVDSVLSDPQEFAADQLESARNAALEGLIDQRLLAQQAESSGLAGTPRVIEAIGNAKREVLSRAYLDQVKASLPKPTQDEAKAYYGSHPELFSSRRVYTIQELRMAPDALPLAQRLVGEKKSIGQIAKELESAKVIFTSNSGVRPAEQMPFTMAARLGEAKDGDTVAVALPTAVAIVHVVSSETQPISEEMALPSIQQFLLKQRESESVAREIRALRDSARLERIGELPAKDASEGPSAPAEDVATSPRVDRASPITAQDIAKGLAGL